MNEDGSGCHAVMYSDMTITIYLNYAHDISCFILQKYVRVEGF